MSVEIHPTSDEGADEMVKRISRMYLGALTESAPWHCIWEEQVLAMRQSRMKMI